MTQIPQHFICPKTQQIYRVPVYRYFDNQKVYSEFEELRESTFQLSGLYYDRKLKQEIDAFFIQNPKLAAPQKQPSTLSTPDDFDLDIFINADEETFKEKFKAFHFLKKSFHFELTPYTKPSNKLYRDLLMQRKAIVDCIATMAYQNPDDSLLQKKLAFLKQERKNELRKIWAIRAIAAIMVGTALSMVIVALGIVSLMTIPASVGVGVILTASMAVGAATTASFLSGWMAACQANDVALRTKNTFRLLKSTSIPLHLLEAYSFKKISTTSDEFLEAPTLYTYQYDGIEQPQMKNSGRPNTGFGFSKLEYKY